MKDNKFRKDMTAEQYLAYLKRQAKEPDKLCSNQQVTKEENGDLKE